MLQQTEGLKVLTDSLRSKHGLDWRNGIVEDRRFEFFRGKDFAAYFKEHPEKFDSWIPDKSGRSKVLCSALSLLAQISCNCSIVSPELQHKCPSR